MKKTIIRLWNWFSNFGVSPKYKDEAKLIQSYNLMSLISALGTLTVCFLAWYWDYPKSYIWNSLFIASIYLGVIVSNYFKKIQLGRYIISIGSPIWQGSSYVFFGGFFCQGLGTICTMAITYVAFQKKTKTKITLISIQLLVFFASTTYFNSNGPIIELVDFPYDELTVFLGGLGWAIIVFYIFNKDRNSLLQTLKTNNQELKNTTEELERFTYIASHDLKSPLSTITNFIGLIERDITKENYGDIQEKLSFVKSGAKQMNFLVSDILEMSKLNNTIEKKRSLIDLNLVLEKVKQNLKSEIKDRKAVIYSKKLPQFVCNEVEFILLFQNFIQNGIKYNESQVPTISISATEHAGNLHLQFIDNGIGIEEEFHEKIFQFFKRLHNSSKYEGTGLGLGLCKKIINGYNGQIKIDSKIGKGTTFTIRFPLQPSLKVNTTTLLKEKLPLPI